MNEQSVSVFVNFVFVNKNAEATFRLISSTILLLKLLKIVRGCVLRLYIRLIHNCKFVPPM
jgi:hypothetical protein